MCSAVWFAPDRDAHDIDAKGVVGYLRRDIDRSWLAFQCVKKFGKLSQSYWTLQGQFRDFSRLPSSRSIRDGLACALAQIQHPIPEHCCS